LDDDICDIHEKIQTFMSSLPEPWRITFNGSPEVKLGDLISVCKASRKGKFSGEACYTLRKEGYLKDESKYDDYINLNFLATEDELIYFSEHIFPKLITCFNAYRAEVTTFDIAISDWRHTSKATREAGKDVYGRNGIYRVWPISYYSKELIQTLPSISKINEFHNGYIFKSITSYFNNDVENYGAKVVSS